MVGPPEHPAFALTDHFGVPVTEKDFIGRFLLVYFGFTSCKVVCPRALEKLAEVLRKLGDAAPQVAPLYITVDPRRDTPDAMRAYLDSRRLPFLGLTGSEEAVEAAKSSFRVFAQRKADPTDPDGYQIAHSAIAYFIGPDGTYLAHFPDTMQADPIVERIRSLLP